MADKKYQVFISSTYSDLIDERRKILDILLMADCIPAGMEAFVATDASQFEVIKKVIDLCDYYILVIGKRYGSINADTGISYTEMEYDYAKEQQIPVLVFVIDNSVDLPCEKVEQDPEKVKCLARFREKALGNRLASVWKTSDELMGAVAVSIMRAKSEISRPGWQRASDYDEKELLREIKELQAENIKLSDELRELREEARQISDGENFAFESCEITFSYHYFDGSKSRHGTMTKRLDQLFPVIAMEMLDVSVTEVGIENAIKRKLFGSTSYYFDDTQTTKTILNQLKALGLVFSKWSNEKNLLFWGLTRKGCKVRDEITLVKKPVDGQ